jgi:hypothetical protein
VAEQFAFQQLRGERWAGHDRERLGRSRRFQRPDSPA